MPLHVPAAPAAATRSVLAALASANATRGTRTPPAIRTAAGALRPELPLPVHVLTGVAGAQVTPRTSPTGWRFLLRGTGAAVGTADAMLTADGWTFSHFGEGPYVASTEKALRRASALSGAFQPRLLSVPELYMLTLWLHSGSEQQGEEAALDGADLLIPLAPAPPGIAADRPHRADALLPLLSRRLVPAPLLTTPA
ncbi:hypothetical protein QNO07_13755 [Streptomyces sp. 549]|uniref:hypothetical protein n=1 Tax=Streptomyces sp. 549 TaxID=3049076 RepID=UPI0024C23D54|nr:hypothetical protein [Streptomyces sp. 549]MDK1474470.1 hypothetical protein [Streptomyces sp. 549]